MDLLNTIDIDSIVYYCLVIVFLLLIFRGMYRLVIWSKRMPKGAFVFLAIFPLISIFPIPAQEIKKLERIKQEEVQNEDESGEPPNDNNGNV
ncbi:hypothetical protein Q4503_00555 [Colwellia sp. 6_MG-2023]|uniref:hypothetical protein n=1 Tax=Colwellia sp. 6_MG-2023 TaxID=3062676 RepID=UPI0026E29775|nr:hypothetical protein [Colwellia sp. 6_MG-2023]MDO6486167.1 hypothetical protein [Colwellia sp. 6_MG-2023]